MRRKTLDKPSPICYNLAIIRVLLIVLSLSLFVGSALSYGRWEKLYDNYGKGACGPRAMSHALKISMNDAESILLDIGEEDPMKGTHPDILQEALKKFNWTMYDIKANREVYFGEVCAKKAFNTSIIAGHGHVVACVDGVIKDVFDSRGYKAVIAFMPRIIRGLD